VPDEQLWQPGQRLTHPAKPEWGVGTVVKAEWTAHEGNRCQRVSVRFARGGLKTVSTAFAKLRPVDAAPVIDAARDTVRSALSKQDTIKETPSRKAAPGMIGPGEAPPDDGPAIDPAKAREIMTRVPEDARDPFTSIDDRLAATIRLYRYQPTGGSLLDWASAQSGLADPLGMFSRHELEQFFDKFRINRDQHLAALAFEARKAGLDVPALANGAPDAARRAMLGGNPRR
jgi:hypothetical protein